MARKVSYEQALVAHGWVVLDPADIGLIESVYKKNLREREEKLMLAVLESAVEDFQKYVLARKPGEEKSYFKRRRSGFKREIAMSFSPMRISVTPCGFIPITFGKGYFAGRKQRSTVLVFSRIPLVARNWREPASRTLQSGFPKPHRFSCLWDQQNQN